MAFRNIQVLLTANSASLRSQLAVAAREVDRFSARVKAADNTVKSSALGMRGMAAAIVAVGAAIAAVVSPAAQFEQRMRNVNSISKLTEAQLKALGASTLDLSRNLPQSANTLAEGLYDVASSGFSGAEGLEVLEASAKAASAGMSDTATAAKGITAVLNAYGMESSKASDVSDVLFQTVNYGVVTFGELASQLGDVVGIAAAAQVPIEDVGAAIAAMTLAGISAAESTTSLNRVIQSVIDPSEELASVFKQWGYESGTAALNALGLNGVMEKLRKTTGGSVGVLLQLFREIRSARGAFALMSASGENYAKTQREIGEASNRAGATQAALNEQMKAVSNQWQVLKNRINAARIELGTRLLPVVGQLINAFTTFGSATANLLGPLFSTLGEILGNIKSVVGDVLDALAPIAGAMAAVFGGVVLGSVQALASLIAGLTGFLADHSEIVLFLAILYGAKFASAIALAAKNLAMMAIDKVAVGMYNAAGGVDRMAGAVRGLSLAAAGAQIGIALLAFGFVKWRQRMDEAKQTAQELANDLVGDSLSSNSVTEMADAYQDLDQKMAKVRTRMNTIKQKMDEMDGWTNSTLGMPPNTLQEYLKLGDELKMLEQDYKVFEDQQNKVTASSSRLENRIKDLTKSTGAGRGAIVAMANQLGVDLAEKGNKGAQAAAKVKDAINDLENATGLDALGLMTEQDIEKMKQLGEAIEQVQKKVDQGFQASFSVFGNIQAATAESQAAAAESLEAARRRLESAREQLADLPSIAEQQREREMALEQASISSERARLTLADAEQKLADIRSRSFAEELQRAELESRRSALNSRKAAHDLAEAEKELRELQAAGRSPAAIAEAEMAVEDAKLAVADSTREQADAEKVLAETQSGAVRAQEERDALLEVREARLGVLQAAQATAAVEQQSVTNARATRDAHQEVADALKAVEEASKAAAPISQQLEQFYTEQTASASRFADNIQKATAAGLDPEIIQRMLMEGPEKAGPILEAMLADNSGRLITMANEGETKLREVNDRMQEFARLTTIAVMSGSQGMISQLSHAMLVAQEVLRQGAAATGASIAEALGMTPAEVKSILEAFDPLMVSRLFRDTRTRAQAGQQAAWGYEPRAMGGIDAHIATQPNVLFGERSTGGEAFIPLGKHHRSRSSSLLRDVAGRFGYGLVPMAQGGVLGAEKALLSAQRGLSGQAEIERIVHQYFFNGDIQVADMEATLRQARRKARASNATRVGAA